MRNRWDPWLGSWEMEWNGCGPESDNRRDAEHEVYMSLHQRQKYQLYSRYKN